MKVMSEEHHQNLASLVEQTIRTLFNKGIAAADLAPLVKLHDVVKRQDAHQGAPETAASAQGEPAPPTPAVSPADAEAQVGWTAGTELSGTYDRDGRRGEVKASEDLMARASAIIDVLVQSGHSPEHAAQVLTRQLLSVGIQLPESGGDARAWKRLLNWRNNLIHYKRAGPAWDIYCAFKEQLAHIPPDKRLQVAVGERLWDQRKQEFSSQNIA